MLLWDYIVGKNPIAVFWAFRQRLQVWLDLGFRQDVINISPHHPAIFACKIIGKGECLIASVGEVVQVKPIGAEWRVAVFGGNAPKFLGNVESAIWFERPYSANDNDLVADFLVALNASSDALFFVPCNECSDQFLFLVHV
jgi:hypothetical protein